VDFGLHIGTRGCLTTRDNVMAVTTQAEAAGYAIIGVSDHLVMPAEIGTPYAYTSDGVHPAAYAGECFDVIATLAFLAGCTQKIRLLTSVAVVPHRPAVLTAKLFQTADVLSNGRVIAGVGAGWQREEFDALGTPPFDERGPVTDEYIRAMKELWTSPRPSFEGKYTRFKDIMFEPKPVSKPHPPIWVGGEIGPSLRRVAQLGDAWYPGSANAKAMLNTPARLKAGIEQMHRACEKYGRDPATVDIAYLWFACPDWTEKRSADGERTMFTGSADAMLEDAAALKAAGVKHLIVYPQRPTIEQTLDTLHRFGADVVRKSS
jgi:probable F420-dependent oxidoreductase